MREIARRLLALHERHPCSFDRTLVAPWAQAYMEVLFPQWGAARESEASLGAKLDELHCMTRRLVGACRPLDAAEGPDARIDAVFDELPRLQELLLEDAHALLAFDPAARSIDEVVLCYPGLLAVAVHRVAHEFHLRGFSLFSRVLAEQAHVLTGIDIHPGARIGRGFAIDHGTGVVVGETTVIGDRVKLYQGVTLGALSVAKAQAGEKRHPTIEDDCVIYANATILGGATVIGKGSVIGGNVWVTRSVPPGSQVYYQASVKEERR